MKFTNLSCCICSFLFTMIVFTSCNGQEKLKSTDVKKQSNVPSFLPEVKKEVQIAEYIRNIYQDKNGNLWFGTNGHGVAHYNGDSISYFSVTEGFEGTQITGIAEDTEKNIWFATDKGVVKYDWTSTATGRKMFTNYFGALMFGRQRFWSIFADSKGNIWAGDVSGVLRFDGVAWSPFELPYPEEINGEFITRATTWGITEDHLGNMWFTTNGFGVFKYDGKSFTQYSSKDGLTDDSVDDVIEDNKGNMWFGTRFGGISKYDGKTFTNYTSRDSIGNDEVCIIYEDSKGNIWFSSEGYGVYRLNGLNFVNYSEKQGLGVRAVQTIFEDKDGRLWVGGGGGLYRFDGALFHNVTKAGPWEK